MKQLSADAYYRMIDRYFDRIEPAAMSNLLKFDHELEQLF